jgi:hypothetical protein
MLTGSYTEQVGHELFTITAELSRIVAWAAFDSGHSGTAQRHFIQALRHENSCAAAIRHRPAYQEFALSATKPTEHDQFRTVHTISLGTGSTRPGSS